MGIFSFFKEIGNVKSLIQFENKINDLHDKSDPQTTGFTNVRRIDDVYISEYAINTALDDFAPVWLLSDQGKIFLSKAAPASEVEHKTIPPVAGEYIFICDCSAQHQDVTRKHFTYRRDPKTISNDIFAYLFDEKKNILVCTVNTEAVEIFKKIVAYRQAHTD